MAKETTPHTDLHTHREAQMYSFYANELEEQAKAIEAELEAEKQQEAKHKAKRN